MKTEPLFDRSEIDQIIHSAKSNRVKFLLRRERSASSFARLGWVGAATAACLSFFASRWHFFHGGLGG